MTQNMVNPSRNEPAIPRPDTNRIQEGVDMLQDAHDLKPKDQGIAQKARMTGDFLKRKMVEYEALQAEIASLQRELKTRGLEPANKTTH